MEQATEWLEEAPQLLSEKPRQPFLLTAGFFETHRPYPPERYEPADPTTVTVPDYLPDTDDVRQDLADFYGAIEVADAAVGRLLDTLSAAGLDDSTWVVFMTDHGPALPRAKSTLYDAGTGIALIVRAPSRLRCQPKVYDELFSGVDLLPLVRGHRRRVDPAPARPLDEGNPTSRHRRSGVTTSAPSAAHPTASGAGS